jgi:hypothetical protein
MSTGGFLVRFAGGMVVGVAVVGLAVAFAVSLQPSAHAGGVLGAGQAGGVWASTQEVAWLRRLGIWETHVLPRFSNVADAGSLAKLAGGKLSHGASARLLQRDLTAVVSCGSDLRFRIGPPPTRRLQNAYALFQHACIYMTSFGRLLRDALASGNVGAVPADEADASQASELLIRADDSLPPGEVRRLPMIAGESTVSRIEPRFGALASALAGHPVEVRCWSARDWRRLLREEKAYTVNHIDEGTLGFAGIDGQRNNLAPDVCDNLVALAYRHLQPNDDPARLLLAQAVDTLTHEPQHSKGIAVEAQAECYAIQLMTGTAEKLGASPAYAASLQRLYWEHYDQELPAYRSPECRNGGAYDLRPTRQKFP